MCTRVYIFERKYLLTNQTTNHLTAAVFFFIRSARQEMPRLLWQPKDRCRVHKSLSTVPILSHMNQIHILPPHFRHMHFNIILLPMPISSEKSLSFRIFNKNLVCISHLPPHAPYIILIISGEGKRHWSS